MQYAEDIIELLDDLPEEVSRRFDQIRRWDQDVERLRLECKDVQRRIFDEKEVLPMKEKERLAIELGEKFYLMRSLTEKKLDMATRAERLMTAILDKTNEGAYHCKIELEVDNPGCTNAIERNFCQSQGLRPSLAHLTDCTMEFEPVGGGIGPAGDDSSSVRSDDTGSLFGGSTSTRPVGRPRNVLKERTNKGRSEKGGTPSSTTSSHHGHNLGKKYKKRKDGHSSSGPISAYMRKKQEKLREQQKMVEMHARREEERRRRREPAQVPQLDVASFCAQACSTSGVVKREESTTPSGGDGDEEEMSWTGALGDMADPLGSDDEFDPSDMMDLFPDMLPSPPREIMESLNMKEDSMFGLDDDMALALEVVSSHANDVTHHASTSSSSHPAPILGSSAAIKGPPTTFPSNMNSPPMRMKQQSSSQPVHSMTMGQMGSPPGEPSDKKKKNLMFGSVSDTSIHGRPRKLTDRAVELLQHQKTKEKSKVKDQDDPDAPWCVCREPSSGEMIECENRECPINWFHFECVGLVAAPQGRWLCDHCRRKGCN